MMEEILTKDDIANRYRLSKATVDTAVSRSPESLPPFFRMGSGRNAPIRFRKSDCVAWEQAQVEQGRQVTRQVVSSTRSRSQTIDFDALLNG